MEKDTNELNIALLSKTQAQHLGEMCAPLVRVSNEEVIVSGSTTLNIHQLISTFYKSEEKRTKILADELTFPCVNYALQSQIKGYDPAEHLIREKSRDGRILRT